MVKRFKVLILGYGEMGHAMEYLFGQQHHLTIWDRHPKQELSPVVLEEVAVTAEIVIFCLPVVAHREIAERIKPVLHKDCICISIAKGLDDAGDTAAQIFADIFGTHQPYTFLYGPMISEEIRAGRCAFAQLGCRLPSHFQELMPLFSGSKLFVEPAKDINGIGWAVILKNVYAIVFGMADELAMGDNIRGYLAVASLKELDGIVVALGGSAGTSFSLAGLGDLITTATSVGSHHHELGRKLARGELEEIKGEGVHTLQMVSKFKLINVKDYPLFDLIGNLILNPSNMKQRIFSYLETIYYNKR